MAMIHATPEQVAELVKKGIAQELEALIKAKLLEIVNPAISQMAREIAKDTAVNVQSYIAKDANHFDTKLVLNLSFNNKNVNYTDDVK
jgi:hypothetical protein